MACPRCHSPRDSNPYVLPRLRRLGEVPWYWKVDGSDALPFVVHLHGRAASAREPTDDVLPAGTICVEMSSKTRVLVFPSFEPWVAMFIPHHNGVEVSCWPRPGISGVREHRRTPELGPRVSPCPFVIQPGGHVLKHGVPGVGAAVGAMVHCVALRAAAATQVFYFVAIFIRSLACVHAVAHCRPQCTSFLGVQVPTSPAGYRAAGHVRADTTASEQRILLRPHMGHPFLCRILGGLHEEVCHHGWRGLG